ncbi:FAD-dependent oxidoreductase [Nocardioides convexus]|uniref:NAD(P)/FAD-dependent oxidoreductase n=1 Tax=Nocardioides convexus TaxID=2712224 RepID=UPI0024183128|nr:FAD-dependent oxidoreductase [Nocardioides convexus]
MTADDIQQELSDRVIVPRSGKHQVVVIGSGFGGLFGTKALRKADVDVTMIAKTTHHLFQPLLYQVATGILSEGEIAPPTREVLANQKNAQVLLGEVTEVDPENRQVTSHVLGREPGHALRLADRRRRCRPVVLRQRPVRRVRARHEEHRRRAGACVGGSSAPSRWPSLAASRGEDVDHLLTFVVVGAGPTGVEMAGQIAESRAPHADPRLPRHQQQPGPGDPGRRRPAGAAAVRRQSSAGGPRRSLEKLGVEVLLGAMVTDVDERGLTVKYKDGTEQRIDAVAKVWAAGVQANPLGKQALRADRRPARPRRPDLGQPGPHAARLPGGLRRRRHDLPRQPPGCRAGRDPGCQVRRQGDPGPARRQARTGPLQVLRQGLDGDHQPLPGGRDGRQSCGSPASSPG